MIGSSGTGRKPKRLRHNASYTVHMTIHRPIVPTSLFLFALMVLLVPHSCAADKTSSNPRIGFDEFFNYVSFTKVALAPDGQALVIGTERADWERSIFRDDLWLYRTGQPLVQLTQSGHDSEPQWSPDGKWVAFLSERKSLDSKPADDDLAGKAEDTAQLFVIAPSGGEAIEITEGEEEVHAFAWSEDSRTLYYATRQPWTKAQKDTHKKEWKDVVQYRNDERGDTIFRIDLQLAIQRRRNAGTKPAADDSNQEEESDATPGSTALAKTPWRVKELVTSPDGGKLAFVSESVSERQERVQEFEIFLVELAKASPNRAPVQLTHNEAVEQDIRWSVNGSRVFFQVDVGSIEGKYKDTQTRLYWIDADTKQVQRWASGFGGAITQYAVRPDGGVYFTGRLGTEVAIYSQPSPDQTCEKLNGWAGTYEMPAMSLRAKSLAFVHSTLEKPQEVYLAEDGAKLNEANAITSFNTMFVERDLPKGKPYRWMADDGVSVEGILMYPPGKFEAKNLPMFTLIHGGPADADGNHFEADWYQWDRLAANQGWLVFEPNYRGSTGYGDDFLAGIVPQIVSRPGKDVLEGVATLVKDGVADSTHLAVGGYSYGGYMTNWLITQSTQWKAAVTGAGSVEHIADWGNDDTSFDDAYFLGGLPWEQAQRYHDEAAIFQMNKVRTPTHIVGGADDIRVAVAEDYLLDHALHALGIPSELLIFPGEGHSLTKNPWHGKIKVRQELKWLETYGGVPETR